MTRSEFEKTKRDLEHLIAANKGESKKYFERQLKELKESR